MQLVDSKLYIANTPSLEVPMLGASRRQAFSNRRDARTHGNLISLLKATSASARLLALMVAALIVVATPALLATIGSTVSLSFQILLQAGHFGLIAFQIFAR